MEHLSLHSLFLSQLIGLYFIITAIIFLVRAKYYRNLIEHMKPNGSIMIGSLVGLLIGLGLICLHNIWIWEIELLLTLVAWFITIKSILWLTFPEKMVKICKSVCLRDMYYVWIAITAIIGVLLLTHGLYLFMQAAAS